VGDGVSLLELGLAHAQLVVATSQDAVRDLGSPRVSGALAASLVGERAASSVGSGLDYAGEIDFALDDNFVLSVLDNYGLNNTEKKFVALTIQGLSKKDIAFQLRMKPVDLGILEFQIRRKIK
jgi:hypothetical protein